MEVDNTLSAIRRNSNGFDFVEALGSFVNNTKFNLGLNQSQVGNDSKDAFIWKALSCIGEDYAEIIYENVLNYIDNAANVDLCKVKALQSMIKIVGVKYEVLESFSNIPVEIANLIDILSINRRYLLDSKTFKSSFYDLLSANGILNQTIQDTVELSSTITLSAIAEGLVHDDSKYINEDQYEQFLKTIYYSVLTSFVYLPYADAENGLPSEHDCIYEYIYNDLIVGQMTYDYDQYTQYQSTIAQLKAKYSISKSFNQEAIVDDIENGYDSFDNYNTFEQQILKYEVERRQQTYSAKKEYDQSNATLGLSLTRYSYYREKKVKEYFKFIEDAYNSLIVESDIATNINNSANDSSVTIKPYEHDINYFDIDQQVKKKFLRYEDGVIEVDTAQIIAIAQMLAEQTLAIADIRDQVKLQIRKSYMRGTFLLISYVINEFLKYNVSNKYGSLFTTEDGQTLKDILDTSIMQGGNVQLIEYYDETQYYNITRDVDSKAQNSDTVNEKFWDNIYSQIGKTTNDIPLEEIDNFYLNQLKLKKSSSVDNLVNFLSILYEYGANDSYISRKTGEFTCKIPGKNPGDDPFYIGDPHNEISALQNDILSVEKIIDGINIYIEKGYPQGISSTIDQISHLCTWVSSDYFWNEISTANESTKDEVIDQICADLDHFNETSEKLSEISSTYEDLKTNSKYKYYLGISASRPYEELPIDQAYFIEKVHNLKLSTQDSSGIVWEHSKLKRDIQYMLNAYNKLSSCLYNGLFTLSVWPSDSVITDLGSPYFSQSTTYWPHYSPHFENELTTVTTDLKNYLVGQAQEQHAGAMQHLQNHYDTLLAYKNDLNRMLEECNDADAKLGAREDAIANLTALVSQVNAELTCLGATSIVIESPTIENVKDLIESAYSQLVSRLNDLENKIQASTEANGWQSLANSDKNLQPFKNRLTRINYINSSENALSNIRSIETMFGAIQLSVQQVLANDSEYFLDFINNEADRLDKQISAIYAYMINRDSQASAEVLSTIDSISSQYTDELLDFNAYALTVNRKYVDSINDNYEYNLMTVSYMDEVYSKISVDPYRPYYPTGVGHDDWPTRYRDCLDYLLSGQYITQPLWPHKENGILYWLEKVEKTFEQTAVEQINIKIPQLPDYTQLTSLLDILANDYAEKIQDEDALLVDKLDFIVESFEDQISYISSQIPFYDESHTIYLKYNGTEIGYDPFYCYSNMAYSSYQIHPYLYNFVEKSMLTYPLASNFFVMFSDYYERQIYSIGIDNMLGRFGNIKDLWKNGMFDWTSYQSKYEKDASRAKLNDGSINPNIGFTGLFYPPAVDAFLNNKDEFLQDVQDDSPASYYHHLNLTDRMLQKIYEQLLAYEPMIRDVATAQDTHQLSGEYDIYRYGEDTLGNSLFLLKSYKHLYAQHKDDPNYRPSYHEKRNTPGELWMRVKNHPLAFPAIDLREGYDGISQYNVKAQVNSTFQNIDINDYMIVLNKYFQSHETIDIFNDNKDSILSVGSITRDTIGHYEIEGKNISIADLKKPNEAQHLRCIFDFEFDPMNQAVLLVVPFKTGYNKQTIYGNDYAKDETKLMIEHMRYANSSVVIGYLGDKVLFNATTDQTYTYIFSKDIYTENLANVDEIENTHMLINGSLEYEGSSRDKRYFTEFIGFAKHARSIYALFAKKYFVSIGNPQFTFKSSKSAKPHLEIECSRYTCHIPINKTTIASDALIYDMYDWQQDDDRVKVDGQPLDYSNASNIAVAGGEDVVTVGFVTKRRQTYSDDYGSNSQIVNFAEYTSQMESYNAISSAGKNVEYPRSTALIQTTDSQHINIYNSFDSFVQYLVNVNFKFVGASLKHQSTNYFNLNSDLGYLPQYVDQHGASHYNNNTALQKKQQYSIELLGPEKSDIAFTPVIKVTTDEKFGRVVEEYKDFNKISAFQKEDIIIHKNYRIATYKFDISSIYIDSLVENGMERSRAESNWQDFIETPELLTYKYIIYNTNYLAMPVLKGNLSDTLPNGYYYQGAEAYDLLSGEQAIGPNQTTYQNINLTNHIDNISAITASVEYDVNDTLLPSALTLSCIARMPDQTSQRVINEGTFYMLLYVKNNVKSYQYYHLFENAHPGYDYTVSSDEAWSIDLAKDSRELSDIRIDGTDKYPFRNNNSAKKPDQLSAALEFKYSEENPINREFPNIDPIDVEDEITIVENDSQSIYYFSLDDSSTIELDAFSMEVYAPNQADPKGEGGRIYKKKVNPLMPKYRNFYDRALVIEATYNMEKSLDETKYEIVQYFNYKNFTNTQYVNLVWQYDSNGNRIETKPPIASVCDQNSKSIEHTYLVLRPGQSGQLDIRVDFVEYQKLTSTAINQSIVGAYTQRIKTYYIMNVSDEKPKFIISRKPFSSDEGVIETGNYELKDAYYNGMIFQYAMMIIRQTRSSEHTDSPLYNYVAMSRIAFEKANKEEYEFPTNADVTIADGANVAVVQPNVPKNLLINDDQKEFFASNLSLNEGNNLSILIDLKEPLLDIQQFDHWSWYNSHCSNSHVGYMPKSFILAFSNDKRRWYKADEQTDVKNAWPTTNYAKAYTGKLEIVDG